MFSPLTRDQIIGIIELSMKDLMKRLEARDITLEMTPEADGYIAEEAYDPAYGARPVKRFIQSHIETEIAGMIIKGDVTDGCTIKIGADESGLTFEVK